MVNKNFMSDNVWGVHPNVMAALNEAHAGADNAYGDDTYTQKLRNQMNILFEKQVTCLPVQSGTGANGLSLSLCAGAVNRILCHKEAHLWESECGAIENYTGGAALEFVAGEYGKVEPKALKRLLSRDSHGFHRQEPSVLSIAQTTEVGTVYTPDEIKSLSDICKEYGLYLHMDGARLANAAALYPQLCLSELTWKLGVDILSFGFTKNGAMGAEAVIVFDAALTKELHYRAKRAGLIASKMRFVSVQILAMLQDDLWRSLGKKANEQAKILYQGLTELSSVSEAIPFESNQLFINMKKELKEALQAQGFLFYDWPSLGENAYRLICSSEIDTAWVEEFVKAAKELS
ncbi:MAG: threonine aldolase family protein [Alphaproteobacteria bacterium]